MTHIFIGGLIGGCEVGVEASQAQYWPDRKEADDTLDHWGRLFLDWRYEGLILILHNCSCSGERWMVEWAVVVPLIWRWEDKLEECMRERCERWKDIWKPGLWPCKGTNVGFSVKANLCSNFPVRIRHKILTDKWDGKLMGRLRESKKMYYMNLNFFEETEKMNLKYTFKKPITMALSPTAHTCMHTATGPYSHITRCAMTHEKMKTQRKARDMMKR